MNFSELERAIFIALEEAGEENLSALLNTVKGHSGERVKGEIDSFRMASTNLVNSGFVEIARFRNQESKLWIPMPKRESLSLLQQLESLLRWSDSDQLWIWSSSSPRAEVLLTASGIDAAREVLSNHGWHGAG